MKYNIRLKVQKDILTTGEVYKPKIKKKMEDFLKKTKEKHLQFYIVFHINLVKETRDGIEERVKTHLHSSTRRLIHMDMYNEIYMEAIESVSKKLDRYSELESGWRLKKLIQ